MVICCRNKKEEDDQSNGEGEEKQKEETTEGHLRSLEIHAVKSYIEARSKKAKIFWLVLLILALTIFVWQFYKTISNYINSPIVSTYTVRTVPAMDFPIVYVCPTAFISNLYLNKTPEAERDAIALKEEMGIVWDYVDFLANGNLTESAPQSDSNPLAHTGPSGINFMRLNASQMNESGQVMQSDLDAEEFFKEATVDLENNCRYCEFRSFMFEEMPCKNITREVLDPEYGKCYVIDVNGRQQTVQSQALVMTYNVRSRWYPKSSLLSPLFNGVFLSVQRKYNVDKSGESILLTPGTYNRIDLNLQHQVFESFDHPYKQHCADNSSYPKFNIFNVSYTQQACAYDCAAQTMQKSCGCVPPVDRSLYNNYTFNGTVDFCKMRDMQCIRNINNDQSIRRELQSCRDRCQRPCEDWRYSIRSTAMDLYKFGFDEGIPVHDLIYILVSFAQMEYTEFQQADSQTPDQMVANVGGEASLWLGAGMLTLLQVPVALISVFGGCCKKRFGKGGKK